MAKNYLDELNTVQRGAVECTEGPVMIVAGAGSGKTRVLTYRISHLMKNGADAFNILALTFTNKAAREMKERIATIVGAGEARNLWMGTFHSVFARILRSEADKIGYPKNFTIYDSDDSKSLIRTILKEQGLDDKIYKPTAVLARISSAKNSLLSAQAYTNDKRIEEEDRMAAKPKMALIYKTYQQRCFKAGAMDFDDLLFNTNILMRDFPAVLHKYQHQFKYIMVDEYQDTNFSQYVIVKQLAAAFRNICVVGDDAQSIYSFRGADIQNILNFQKDYPELKTFKLEQNYRSSNTIVEAANMVIANNKNQLKKKTFTDNEAGSLIKVSKSVSDNAEGNFVANTIAETKALESAQYSDFAILYRTNAQSRAMEEALRKQNIPYRIHGGLSFYQRKEVKDLLCYFQLLINNDNEIALKRVINYPARGIGNTTMDRLAVAANDHNISMWKVISNINEFDIGLNAGAKKKLDEFAVMIKSFSVMLDNKSAYELAQHVAVQSGILRELYADKTPEGVARHENIQELLNGIKDFSDNVVLEGEETPEQAEEKDLSLAVFMEDIALLTDADKKVETEEDKNKVTMMTIHSSKGLEFPYVHIVGLEENLFPSQMALQNRDDLEEERRLFYVAVTRAEKGVTLSYATSRYRWGNLIYCEASRFIEEIGPDYVDLSGVDSNDLSSFESPTANPRQRFIPKQKNNDSSSKTNSSSTKPKQSFTQRPVMGKLVKASNASSGNDFDIQTLKNLQTGMTVSHNRFGTGKVVNMEGNFPNNKATIFFTSVGQKQLLIKFAKLEIIGT